MLKKVLLTVLLTSMSINVMADDKPLQFQLLSATDEVYDKKDLTIVVKEQKNGVYVLAAGGWSGKYPNTTKLVRDMMVAKGIKVTDDPAIADVGLQFSNISGFSLDDVESQSNHIDGGKIAAGVGAVLGGGIFGIAGMLGSSVDKPVVSTFMAIAADKPTITGRNKIDGENKKFASAILKYQANKTGSDVSTAAFVAYVDDFIKKHFVFDTPDSAASASSVGATTSMNAVAAAQVTPPVAPAVPAAAIVTGVK